MNQEHVFLVAGTVRNATVKSAKSIVVVALNDEDARDLINKARPDFDVVSVTSLIRLLGTIKMIRDCLEAKSDQCEVFMHPAMQDAYESTSSGA